MCLKRHWCNLMERWKLSWKRNLRLGLIFPSLTLALGCKWPPKGDEDNEVLEVKTLPYDMGHHIVFTYITSTSSSSCQPVEDARAVNCELSVEPCFVSMLPSISPDIVILMYSLWPQAPRCFVWLCGWWNVCLHWYMSFFFPAYISLWLPVV